jgi:hypothetical protein
MEGVGFTSTFTVCVLEQPFAESAKVYGTVISEVELFSNVSTRFPVPVAEVPLLMAGNACLLQLYTVPEPVDACGVKLTGSPLQIAGGAVFRSTGNGFTETTTFCEWVQPAGVFNVYTYVTGMVLVNVFTSVSEGSPVPKPAGLLMPVTGLLDQAKEVPAVFAVGW